MASHICLSLYSHLSPLPTLLTAYFLFAVSQLYPQLSSEKPGEMKFDHEKKMGGITFSAVASMLCGVIIGSTLTQFVFPRPDWRTCRQIGLDASATGTRHTSDEQWNKSVPQDRPHCKPQSSRIELFSIFTRPNSSVRATPRKRLPNRPAESAYVRHARRLQSFQGPAHQGGRRGVV